MADGSETRSAAEIADALTALLERVGPREAADEALAMARRGLSLLSREEDPAVWAELQLRVGLVATLAGYDRGDLGLLRAAIDANAAALTVHTQAGDPARFKAEHNRALGLVYLGQLTDDPEPMREAARRLRAVLRLLRPDAPDARWPMCMNSLGTALQNIGMTCGEVRAVRRAAACYRAAARAYLAVGYPVDARSSTYNLGLAHAMTGNLNGDPAAYDRAIGVLETIRGQTSPQADLRDWANVSNAIALVRANRGDITGDPSAIAEAISECEAILAAMPRERHPGWWAMAMVNVCDFRLRLASLRGDPAGLIAAAEGARSALEVASAEALPAYWSALMQTAAEARLRLGRQMGDPAQVGQAVALAGEVLEAGIAGPREQAGVLALRGRASLRLATLRPDEAEPWLKRALADLEAALDLTDRKAAPGLWAGIGLSLAESRGLAGTRRRDVAQLAVATAEFRAVLAALPEAEASPRHGAALAGIGRAGLALAMAGAEADPLAVAADFAAARAHLHADLDPVAAIETERGQAAALLLAGRWEDAAAMAGALIDRAAALIAAEPAEHARLWLAEALAGTGDIAAYALLRLDRTEEALARHEQGRAHRLRARLRLAEAALSRPDAERIDRLRRRADLARRSLAQAIDGDRPAAAVARLAASLTSDHARLVAAMTQAGLDAVPEAPDKEALRGTVPEGVIALPVVTCAGGALVLIGGTATTVDIETIWLDGLTVQAVENLLAPSDGGGWLGAYAAFRGALADGAGTGNPADVGEFQRQVASVAGLCWRLLMGPLDRRLNARGLPEGSEVVLIPDGRLSALPLHAAGTEERTVLDGWAVSYAPSLAALATCRRRAAGAAPAIRKGNVLAVTDPRLDLGRLVNPAATVVPAERINTLHGPAATRSAVIEALPGAAYVSVFSHAVWDAERPERSALLLADDERLTAEDFAGLDLGGCRMVVLGACESGVPGLRMAADEFRGMPAALLEAGIPGVLATLWPVFTEAADRVLADFFHHHLADDLAPAQALRCAQMKLRRSASARVAEATAMGLRRGAGEPGPRPARARHDLSLPAYWAAFAYIGA